MSAQADLHSKRGCSIEIKNYKSKYQSTSMTENFWKKGMIRLLPLLCLLVAINAMAQNPCAQKDAMVISGNTRFTVLTPEMIRIEYSDKGIFEDRATFAIQNRQLDVIPAFSTSEDNDYLYINVSSI